MKIAKFCFFGPRA